MPLVYRPPGGSREGVRHMSSGDAMSGAMRADSPEPLWLQAAEFIKREIEAGALKPGSRLPPERVLGEQLNISRVTVRKALTQLIDEGVLSASHGRGWYVAASADATAKEWPNTLESFSETARKLGLVASSRVIAARVRPATWRSSPANRCW
jgi:GntR family transcriptional regulator